jgi:hypothetical protein
MQYLYLIECRSHSQIENRYKIGITSDISRRLAQLSTGNPFPLQLHFSYEFENAEIVEKCIHQKFSKERESGEWFKLNVDQIAEVEDICRALGGIYSIPNGYIFSSDIEISEAEKTLERMSRLEKYYVKNGIFFDDNGNPHGKGIDNLKSPTEGKAE